MQDAMVSIDMKCNLLIEQKGIVQSEHMPCYCWSCLHQLTSGESYKLKQP